MKKLLALLAVGLPLPLKLFIYRKVFKWRIGKGVKIGLSFIQADYVELGDGTHIGHFNVIRKVKRLVMGKECLLLNFNEIAGGWLQVGNASEVIFADKVLVMSHQYFDALGTIKIGANTTIGGRDTHFWTHTRKTLEDGSPILVPLDIVIGEDVYTGARVTFVGCEVPDGAMVGAGAVVVKSFPKEEMRVLLAGNPASVKKRF